MHLKVILQSYDKLSYKKRTCNTRSFVDRKNDDSGSGEIQTMDDLKTMLKLNLK